MRTPAWRALGLILTLAGLVPVAGCGTIKVSGTARTATEQLLLSSAWDEALQRVDFRPLSGVPVYFDPQYVNSTLDQGWMVSSIRQAMLSQGVLLRAKPDQAQWIVEARVGSYGTNDSSFMLGVPQTTLPAVPGFTTAANIPEMAIAKKNRQQGVAKLAIYAYDRASGQVVWTSGTQQAITNSKDVSVGGIGPFHSGPEHDGTELAGVRLPSLPDATPARPTKSGEPESLRQAPLSLPSAPSDPGIFAP